MESKLQQYLNQKANEYLRLIISEFGNLGIKNNLGEITLQAEQLLSSDIIVVESNDVRLQEQYVKEGIKKQTPLAHGGRTFGDGKIHFYPSKSEKSTLEEVVSECESTLIHELFHYFIRPQRIDEQNNPNLAGINSFITEGIVDMYARNFMKKYNLFSDYNSNYGRNVLFVKDLLNVETIDINARNRIAFNASISDILSISPYSKEFYKNFCREQSEINDKSMSVKTPFETYTYNMIENIVSEEDRGKIPEIYNTLMNRSANCQNTADAKIYVDGEAQKYTQSKNQTISKPKIRVKTLPTQSNNGYINIVIVISAILVCCLMLVGVLLFF